MRITTIVLMALVCVAQTACVSQRETIPPETRAELIRLGRIIIDENEAEETRSKAQISYCELVMEAIEKYGKKSVDWNTVIDSFMVEGRKPKNLTIRDGWLHYFFWRKDETLATITIYGGGWSGSYVGKAYPGGGIP